MLEIRKIDTEENAIMALKKQNPGQKLPDFLFRDLRYKGIVLSLLNDGVQIGLTFGVIAADRNDSTFFLHYLSVDKGHSDLKTDSLFMEMLFVYLEKEYGLRKVIISIPTEGISELPILKLIKKISFCRIEKVIFIRQLGLKTADFTYLRQFRWYCPQFLNEGRYTAVLWSEYDKEQIDKIRRAEISGMTEKDYLSPGVWETDWTYDEKTSFVLINTEDRKPLGWIITEKIGDGRTVRLRRFYIYKEARRKMLGPAFSTWVLDVIAKHYEYMHYEVVQGNRQMEMFTDCYCRPVLIYDYYRCNITISI